MEKTVTKEAKPHLTLEEAVQTVKRLYGLTVSKIKELVSYSDQNFHVQMSEGGEFLLKVMNAVESYDPTLVELMTLSMHLIQQKGIPAQTAQPLINGEIMSVEEMDFGFGKKRYVVRLLSFLPGTTISNIPRTPQILYETGKVAAQMDEVLQELKHPRLEVLKRENYIWSLCYFSILEECLPLMEGHPAHQMMVDIMTQYNTKIKPNFGQFRKGINHADLNDKNILVVPDGSSGYKISGILDFGNMHIGYYVMELTVVLTYMMMDNPNPMETGGPVIAGWESILPLNEAERDSLYLLVLCQICQVTLLSRHYATFQPDNTEYILSWEDKCIDLLTNLWKQGKTSVEARWFQDSKEYIVSK